MKEHKDYRAYDYDRLEEGAEIKIEHHVYYNNDVDLSDLISKPLSEVQTMYDDSTSAETAAYEKVIETAREWEKQAAVTSYIRRAVEYIKTPEAEHSSNKWGKDRYGNHDCISNRVYKMYCRINDYNSWRSDKTKYNVEWSVYTNSPRKNYNIKVAGQERAFTDKAAAEKYLQGRIKAYSHLFTEISPPIPDKYINPFKLYGHILPGYTTEAMQRQEHEKPSIKNQLKELKTVEKNTPSKTAVKKCSVPELE